ncbi:MAG: cob(I)yrinic acid a,c-diamide adenosyltransferase [Xanthomonadales bacterium]|nr:cob(I)yrinic acid a,c-diamide adenosyltransferase [Xanthomonadales bacterium]
MGHRLSKIYTRTGDDGSTGLGDGSRVSKDHLRVEAYGTVDELNSVVGMVLAELSEAGPDQEVFHCLVSVQHDLFDLGGELSIPEMQLVKADAIERLESTLDRFNAELKPLKEFILPGGGRAASCCHLARTVARRAERRLISLSAQDAVNEEARRYLNRLSDLLFVIARRLAVASGEGERLWQQDRQR